MVNIVANTMIFLRFASVINSHTNLQASLYTTLKWLLALLSHHILLAFVPYEFVDMMNTFAMFFS